MFASMCRPFDKRYRTKKVAKPVGNLILLFDKFSEIMKVCGAGKFIDLLTRIERSFILIRLLSQRD